MTLFEMGMQFLLINCLYGSGMLRIIVPRGTHMKVVPRHGFFRRPKAKISLLASENDLEYF